MPIAREDGFFCTHDLAHVSCLGIESARLGECVDRVKANRVSGVFGNPHFGFSGSDLHFLSELPWIEAVWFWDVNLKDVEGLYALQNLQHFGVHPKRPPIDFSRFPRLRKAIIEPKAKDRGLETLDELELLHVWHFRPKDGSFASLALPPSLEELQINWASPRSLDSLPVHRHLRRLEIHRCRNLEDLGDLGGKFPNLEHLVVDACGRVPQSEGERAVRDLPKLVHAFVQRAKLA
jgi:hypothetical protein